MKLSLFYPDEPYWEEMGLNSQDTSHASGSGLSGSQAVPGAAEDAATSLKYEDQSAKGIPFKSVCQLQNTDTPGIYQPSGHVSLLYCRTWKMEVPNAQGLR